MSLEFVNPPELVQPGLPDIVAACVREAGIAPDRLTLEITESSTFPEFEPVSAVVAALHAQGCQLAIDDFGTGYSSLAQLQQLPADEIKIDKSFVMDMDTNGANAAIVRSTIGLGQNLALDVTAEGAATKDHRK